MNRFITLLATLGIVMGCNLTRDDTLVSDSESENALTTPVARSNQERFGTHFFDKAARFRLAPVLSVISFPPIPKSNSIWGASGRDDQGNIYFGVSCKGPNQRSATLCRITPGAKVATRLGDANSNLDRLATIDPSPQQEKIHGKPVQANDGFVYFASMDEAGEKDDGSALPRWGSHLWRIDPLGDGSYWEHLLEVPEALIATSCTGRYVYALGYFDHIVYQFDTETSTTRVKTVGSVGGHISRNFLLDLNEHCYIPRLSRSADGDIQQAELVELDAELNVVIAHPLPEYGATSDSRSHGIVSFVTLKNGDLVFVTAKGAMFQIHPDADGVSNLKRLGWIHPEGESYAAFLICPDGESVVCAIARRRRAAYQWVTYDLQSNTPTVVELSADSDSLLQRKSTLAYGSNTLDNLGNAFIVGWYSEQPGGIRPMALRVNWP